MLSSSNDPAAIAGVRRTWPSALAQMAGRVDVTVAEKIGDLPRKWIFFGFNGNATDGKLKQIVQAGGTTSFTYDGQGRVSTITDPYGRVTNYVYSGLMCSISGIALPAA